MLILRAIKSVVTKWSLSHRLLATVLVVAVIGGGIEIVHAVSDGPTRSPEAFCKTYTEQKQQYLDQYGKQKANPTNLTEAIGGITNGLAAMGSWSVIFDHLDKVAPDDIEPDVAKVRDSLKQEQDNAAANAGSPYGGLATGLATSLMVTGSWQRVDEYIQTNCRT